MTYIALCKVTGNGICSTPRIEYLKNVDGVWHMADGSGFSRGWLIEEVERYDVQERRA